jgi:hypothetical protein
LVSYRLAVFTSEPFLSPLQGLVGVIALLRVMRLYLCSLELVLNPFLISALFVVLFATFGSAATIWLVLLLIAFFGLLFLALVGLIGLTLPVNCLFAFKINRLSLPRLRMTSGDFLPIWLSLSCFLLIPIDQGVKVAVQLVTWSFLPLRLEMFLLTLALPKLLAPL